MDNHVTLNSRLAGPAGQYFRTPFIKNGDAETPAWWQTGAQHDNASC